MIICPAGAELLYADRQARRSKYSLFAISRSRLIRAVPHLIVIKDVWHPIQFALPLLLRMPSVYQDIWTSSSVKPTTGFRGLQHAKSVTVNFPQRQMLLKNHWQFLMLVIQDGCP